MALLTTKGIYGLMAIFEIAKASEISPISIKEISDKTGISKGYLEQILNDLRNSALISSLKGKGGGYFLKKSLDEITFFEIFNALEKDIKITNLNIKDSAIMSFFNECDEEIKKILDEPLSQILKQKQKDEKYLNFVI
ncbi:Rrf2 family transcriptional regulator [Campylobacter sp. FMV-PI01]|uniref:Rrf2 family transcriptional regulator n=1 Tax=Campylobacter portucalensis TaxID=2608384 RepID=A0A6L5WJI3_9BACT|nr:Rrf2 family transcriptional regulator [Campylobacter portucalensis]MSN96003.1 Rrf2 family transcriptional regulator [Campylobacter portucalensis]